MSAQGSGEATNSLENKQEMRRRIPSDGCLAATVLALAVPQAFCAAMSDLIMVQFVPIDSCPIVRIILRFCVLPIMQWGGEKRTVSVLTSCELRNGSLSTSCNGPMEL